MFDKLLALKAFCLTADTLSFSKTASILGVSIASVSRLISDLEKSINIRLLNRSTRSVSLTTDGSRYLLRARNFLMQAEEIFTATENDPQTIRISASVPFYDMCLGEILAQFSMSHPEVRIDYSITASPLNLVRDAIDIGFQEGTDPQEGYIARHLGQIESWMCASPYYLEKFGIPQSIEELSNHRILSLQLCNGTWSFMHKDEIITLPVNPVFSANFSSTLLACCLQGGGISFQPVEATRSLVEAGKLCVVLSSFKGLPHSMNALVASRQNLSSTIRVLLDFITRSLKPSET